MKKLTALLLSLLMLIPMLSLGISAGTTVEHPDDKMVLHYDFEGQTEEEARKNKAYKGTATDAKNTGDLMDDTSGRVVADMEWNFNGEVGTYAYPYADSVNAYGPLIARQFLKQYVVNKEYTVFIRMKLDPEYVEATTANIDHVIMRYDSTTSNKPTLQLTYRDSKGDGDDYFSLYINNTEANCKARNVVVPVSKLMSGYVNIAAVVSKSGDDYRSKLCISFENPASTTDWSVSGQTTIGTSIIDPGTNIMYLFGRNSKGGIVMDDFRIYNDDLTVDELQSIFAVEEEPVSELVKNFGAQNKFDDLNNDGTNDAFSVRFVGGIDSENYDNVGIEIITTVGEKTAQTPHTETSQTVYTSVIENGETVLATTKGSAYFIAFIVPDIPLNLELGDGEYISFKYRFFAENGNTTLYSEYITVTYTADGVPVI